MAYNFKASEKRRKQLKSRFFRESDSMLYGADSIKNKVFSFQELEDSRKDFNPHSNRMGKSCYLFPIPNRKEHEFLSGNITLYQIAKIFKTSIYMRNGKLVLSGKRFKTPETSKYRN